LTFGFAAVAAVLLALQVGGHATAVTTGVLVTQAAAAIVALAWARRRPATPRRPVPVIYAGARRGARHANRRHCSCPEHRR
jgi:hypothetical protein